MLRGQLYEPVEGKFVRREMGLMAVFTAKQKEIIADNLRAFTANFGDVRIEKADYGKGFYVFYPADSSSWIQYCYDINYLNGWLYGVVQGVVRGEFKGKRREVDCDRN